MIFFTSEKIRIGFSRFSGRSCEVIESECLQSSLLSQIMASRFADINSVEQFIEDQENENTRENSTEYKEIEFISSF